MTCDNIDSDAAVFAQNCIIFVHYAMLCLEFISVCMYACTILVSLFYTHSARVFSMLSSETFAGVDIFIRETTE